MGKRKKQVESVSDLSDSDDKKADASELEVLHNILDIHSGEEYSKIKPVFYATTIFILLSIPYVDNLFEMISPISKSWLIRLCIKTVLFFITFYFIFYANKDN